MDRDLANILFDSASTSFAFLAKEHGFSPPQLRIDDEIHFAVVTFKGRHLAIECIVDQREEDLDCKIAVLRNGEVVGDTDHDDAGARVREGIYNWVVRHGVREPGFRKTGHLPFRERIPVKLEDFAAMLKKHGEPVVQDSPAALSA